MAYAPTTRRLFYWTPVGANWQLRAHGAIDLGLLDTMLITNVIGTPSSLIHCGGDRLAFRTGGNQIFVVRFPISDPADVVVSQTHSPEPAVGNLEFSLLVTATNMAPGSVAGVVVTNRLPAEAELLSFQPSKGTVTADASSLRWVVGSLPGGGSASLSLRMRATNSHLESVTNSAEVSSAVADPAPSNNLSREAIQLIANTDRLPIIISQVASRAGSTTAKLATEVNPNRSSSLVHFEESNWLTPGTHGAL